MSMNIRFFFFAISALLFFSCGSEPTYEVVDGEPEIFFKGTIDGEFRSLEAGVDDAYNFTFVEMNEFDFYNLHSKLSGIDSVGPSLEIVLLDPGEIDDYLAVDERFSVGARSFLRQSEAISAYSIRLSSNQLSNYLHDYEWITDEGNYYTSNPEITFYESGSKLICLKGQTVDGDTIHTCKRINLDQDKSFSPQISILSETTDSIFIKANIHDLNCDMWEWNGYGLSDYVFSIPRDNWGRQLTHLKMYNSGYLVSDLIFRGEHDENSDPHIGKAGFSYTLLTKNIKDRLQHGKVIINYDHPENGLYSSKYADNRDQQFEIRNVQAYLPNENGVETVLVTLDFSALLQTEFGHQMLIESEEVKMAFPIPES